jgi:uncharacterized coiled-coil protein SlyX
MQYVLATKNSIPAGQKRADREPFSAGSLKLPLLQSEMNKLNEKNISLLEQKIAHQEADISLLKDMIKARDLTIERLQKELQELTSLRDREKSSGMVVSDLAQSIKSNVDSGFKNVQDTNNGVDFNKLIIEVKKQLAMSFLSDFKDTKIDRSTMGSKINLGSSFMNSPASSFNPAVPQDKPNSTISNLPNISSMNITGTPQPSIPNLSTNSGSSMHPTNTAGIPNSTLSIPNSGSTVPITNLYYQYPYPPSYKYNPFYTFPPTTQPSAPSFYPPGCDPTMKPT